MSNTTRRSRGLAQRALALLMAIALATALTPSFALAEEANNAVAATAEQSSTAGSASSPSTADATTNKADTTPDASENQASGSSSTAGHATASSPKANAGETADPSNANKVPSQSANGAEPANQASSTKADTVSATLKISVYGTTLVSHTFTIEKGKTVEDLLSLAKTQGYIDGYEPYSPSWAGGHHYVKTLTLSGTSYELPEKFDPYWASLVNGSDNDPGIDADIINKDGYIYELSWSSYSNPDQKYDNGTADYPTAPDAQHPDKTSGNDTTSYVKNTGNTSTVTSAPTSSSNAALAWKKQHGRSNCSEILAIGDSVFFVSSPLDEHWHPKGAATLYRLNAKTGEETATLQLFSAIDSTCRPVYTDGVIVVPLASGRLQGISASEMKTLWVSEAISSKAQALSTVTAANGMVFTGTVEYNDDYTGESGAFFGINAITGQRVWANKESDTGYYWAGACKVGNVLVYGNDEGILSAVDPATGKTVSTLKLSSGIRSTAVSNTAETEAYVTTTDGTLHKIAVASDGSLSESNATSFASKSTSTATLFQGNLFVGGCAADYTGILSIIDAATMQVKHSVSLPFEVKSAPLVAKAADGKTYAYFTCNGAEMDEDNNCTNGGGAWVYCLETNTATKLFEATGDMANYCMKSITMGSDGTLYWTNDSGTLFALASTTSSSNNGSGSNSDNTQTPEKPGANNQQNNKAPSSTESGHAPAATPISAGSASAAAQAPLSDAETLAENEASGEDENGSAVTSASSARGTSSDNSNDSKGAPWLPIAGIVAGCAGLIAVGAFLFRRRSL